MKLKITIKGDRGIFTYIVKSEDSSFDSPSVKKKIDSQKFFERFKQITNGWPSALRNPRMLGGDNVEILFVDEEQKHQYRYHNGYPPNYMELIYLIKETEDGRIE